MTKPTEPTEVNEVSLAIAATVIPMVLDQLRRERGKVDAAYKILNQMHKELHAKFSHIDELMAEPDNIHARREKLLAGCMAADAATKMMETEPKKLQNSYEKFVEEYKKTLTLRIDRRRSRR